MRHRHDQGSDWYTFQVKALHLNAAGHLHGGFFCTVLDLAMGHAAWHSVGHTEPIERMATVALNVCMMRAAHLQDELTLQVDILRTTRELVFLSARVHCATLLLAQGQATLHYRLKHQPG
nr:PaaI family thioesterase [Limnobacter humi]